jgi:hypothetical protein
MNPLVTLSVVVKSACVTVGVKLDKAAVMLGPMATEARGVEIEAGVVGPLATV